MGQSTINILAFWPSAPHLSRALITRRAFFTQTGLLALGAGAAILLRDRVLWPPPRLIFPDNRQAPPQIAFVSRSHDALAIIAASASGAPVRALIDTGAQISVIDRAFVETSGLGRRLGPPMIAYGVGGGAQIAQGVRLDVQLGDLTIRGLTAAIVDLGPLAAATGLATGLILGQDVISRLIVDIDFPHRRMALSPPQGFQRPSGVIAAPVRRHGRALNATVVVEGHPVEVTLDTGASGLLSLSVGTARSIGLFDGRPQRTTASIVLGGMSQSPLLAVNRLDFAGRVWSDVDISLYTPPLALGFPNGLLGVEALRDYRAILDIGAGRLDLLPSTGAKAPHRQRRELDLLILPQ